MYIYIYISYLFVYLFIYLYTHAHIYIYIHTHTHIWTLLVALFSAEDVLGPPVGGFQDRVLDLNIIGGDEYLAIVVFMSPSLVPSMAVRLQDPF